MSQAETAKRACSTRYTISPGITPGPAPTALWWTRDFSGEAEQVREARRWIEDLLPGCDLLEDIVLLASELCANAVKHTLSGEMSGWFSVHVEWAPSLARLVIGDQGSLMVPSVGEETAGTEESGRGLRLVEELADDWGTACHPAGRVVWVDVQWQARGGPPLHAPDGTDTTITDIVAMRGAFPGATFWWGHQTKAWWAALPVTSGGSGLFSSPTREGLRKVLADAWPKSRWHSEGSSLAPVPQRETLAALASDQPENL
jgi:serine/threonine-protein kinase RsbW